MSDTEPWEPVADFWCVTMTSGITIDVTEEVGRAIMRQRDAGRTTAVEFRDILGARHLFWPADVVLMYDNGREFRRRLRLQNMALEEEHEADVDGGEHWKRGR